MRKIAKTLAVFISLCVMLGVLGTALVMAGAPVVKTITLTQVGVTNQNGWTQCNLPSPFVFPNTLNDAASLLHPVTLRIYNNRTSQMSIPAMSVRITDDPASAISSAFNINRVEGSVPITNNMIPAGQFVDFLIQPVNVNSANTHTGFIFMNESAVISHVFTVQFTSTAPPVIPVPTPTPPLFNLTVVAMPGSAPSVYRLPQGETIPITAGARPGYIFDGWELEAAGGAVTITPNMSNNRVYVTMPNRNVYLRGTWIPIPVAALEHPVTIAHLPVGASITSSQSPTGPHVQGSIVEITAGTVASTHSSYRFNGWIFPTNVEVLDQGNVARFVMPDHPVTVTANWVRSDAVVSGVTVDQWLGGPSATELHPQGAQVTIVAGTRIGYTFTGWRIVSGGISTPVNNQISTFIMPGGPVHVEASWAQNTHPVNPVSIANFPVGHPGPVQVATSIGSTSYGHRMGAEVTVQAGLRTGYTFIGWTAPPNVAGSFDTPTATFTMPNHAVTLTANWSLTPGIRRRIDIQNYPPSGSLPVGQTPTGVYGVGGERVTVVAGTRAGFTFGGWTIVGGSTLPVVFGNASHNSTTFIVPEGTVSIQANWISNTSSVSITNTGSLTNAPNNQRIFINNVEHLGPTAPVIPVGASVRVEAGTHSSHVFGGFGIIGAGGDLNILRNPNRAEFLMPDGNVSIEVRWLPVGTPSRTVRVYRQIGDNSGNRDLVSSGQYLEGAIVTLNAHWLDGGHNFINWISAPADLVSVPTSNLTHFTVPTTGSGDVVITSRWVVAATQLPTPLNVRLNGTVVSWDAVPAVVGTGIRYHIYVNGVRVSNLVLENVTSFDLATLNPSLAPGSYNIQVRAISTVQAVRTDSELTGFLQFVVTAPPTPENTRPTGLSIVNSTLRWNPVTGATQYFIYVNNSRRATIVAANLPNRQNPVFDLTTISNPRLSTGTGYDIQVRAYVPVTGGNNVTSHLSEVRRFYEGVPALPTVTNVRIVGNPTLMWDFPTGHAGLVGFRIYVNGQASPHMAGPNARSFPISSLGLAHGTYLIGVRAVGNGIANTDSYLSTYVQYVSATLPALNTPVGLHLTGNVLTWPAVPNATGYRIYVNGQPSTSGIIGGLSFNLTTLGLGAGTHLIQVRAIGNNVTHTDSAISAFVTYVLPGSSSNPGSNVAGARQYVVAFNPGPGSFPAGEDGLRMGPAGFVINSFTNTPTRAGYTFGGWQAGGTAVSLPLTVNGDMTLNAVWTRIATPAPTPTPAGNVAQRPNPQTGALGFLNVGAVLVLTGVSVFVIMKLAKKKDKVR